MDLILCNVKAFHCYSCLNNICKDVGGSAVFLFVLSFLFFLNVAMIFSLWAWMYDGYSLFELCFDFVEDLSCWFNGLLKAEGQEKQMF